MIPALCVALAVVGLYAVWVTYVATQYRNWYLQERTLKQSWFQAYLDLMVEPHDDYTEAELETLRKIKAKIHANEACN